MCRAVQKKIPKAIMITNAGFKGDMAAIRLKTSRGEDLRNLQELLSEEEAAELAKAEEMQRRAQTLRAAAWARIKEREAKEI
jgi:cytochrome c553